MATNNQPLLRLMTIKRLDDGQIIQTRRGFWFRVHEVIVPRFLYIVTPYNPAKVARGF